MFPWVLSLAIMGVTIFFFLWIALKVFDVQPRRKEAKARLEPEAFRAWRKETKALAKKAK